MKKNSASALKICQIVFFIVAVVFFVIALGFGLYADNFAKNAKLTDATIIDLNGSKNDSSVTLSYEVNGSEYRQTLSDYSSTWDKGDTLKIYYQESNPKHIHIKSLLFLVPILFGILGGCFLLTVIILGFVRKAISTKQKNLMETGRRVYVTISEVVPNYNVRVNGKNPYQARATYTDEYGKSTYQLKSKNFWKSNMDLIGQQVPVYLDPKNPKHYYMDIDSLIGKNYYG